MIYAECALSCRRRPTERADLKLSMRDQSGNRTNEFRGLNLQRMGQCNDVEQSDVALSTLDSAYVVAM